MRDKTFARGALALIATVFLLGACVRAVGDFFRGYADGGADGLAAYDRATLTPAQRGAVAFTLSDFGGLNTDTLETHAVPWRLAAAALVLHDVNLNGGEVSLARVRTIMTRFGFLYPERIGNWPEGLAPPERAFEAPLGVTLGAVRRGVPPVRLTTANLGCASCHAGVTYGAAGDPITGIAWIGAPNTSLDLEAYVGAIYAAFKAARGDEARLLATMQQLFPDTTPTERNSIHDFVLPRMRARLDQLEQANDRPLPFINGAPGLTNGVAALAMQFGVLRDDAYDTARGFTSIPDLGARGFRSALLYDAAYAPRTGAQRRIIARHQIDTAHLNTLAEITAYFTVPSMGVHPDRAADHFADARDVFAFLRDYAPPRFPGAIERTRAARGRDVYARACASCHGTYDDSLERPELLSFPNWIGPFDTDPVRADAFTPELIAAVERSAYAEYILARRTGQYAAPPLSGLWLSAPYLHNGSVPTLWHLMHPQARPARFQVGGHRLDFTRVGVAGRDVDGDYLYPQGYRPWSAPILIDTRTHGLSNRGHAAEFEALSEAERRDLLEYLKLL